MNIPSNSDVEGSWIGSSFTLGAVLSAPIGGHLMRDHVTYEVRKIFGIFAPSLPTPKIH